LDIAASAEPAVVKAAKKALQTLPGETIDAELAGRLAQAQGSARLALIETVGERRIEAAVPALLKAADDSDTQVRAAALTALGATVTAQDLPVLIDRVVKSKDTQDAQEALRTACIRMPDREACAEQLIGAMAKAPAAAQVAFIEILGAMGGSRALGALSAAAKEGNDELKDAASEQLGKWMTTDAAPVLMEIARVVREEKYKIRALRGYLRIAKQIETRPDARVELCQKILPLCQRDDEKRLLVTALEPKPTTAGLKLVASLLKQSSLKDEAGRAAVAMAEELIKSDKAVVAEAMQQVIAAGVKPEVTNRARELAEQAKR
jgi:HEAT repeat protein